MANTTQPDPPLPSVRRVITGHTPSGASTVLVDGGADAFRLFPGATSFFANIHHTADAPPRNAAGLGRALYEPPEGKKFELVGESGSVMWVVDMAPGAEAPFHRTLSLDYGIVIKGSIVLTLDNNERRTLNAGDVVVQRGTIHGWINETDEWTRMYFVMLPSKKVVIDGKELDKAMPGN